MFISFRSPREILDENPTFLICTIVFQLLALLSLIHAIRSGPRGFLLWISALGHGFVTEAISYFLPDIDSFWHSQSMVMFLNRRLPLYIALFYPTVMYTTNTAVERLRLTSLAHPLAVALADVVMDFPYDIVGIKLLWWTWHDTDPNIFDRHYSVPWTSYLFHMTFASSLSFLFNMTWNNIVGDIQRLTWFQKALRLSCCFVLVSLLSMPLGVLQFIPLYHVLHDIYHIHTEAITFIYVFIYGYMMWSSDRKQRSQGTSCQRREYSKFDLISVIVFIHYTFYIILALFVAHPENLKSTGLHETVGNCSSVSNITSTIGMTLQKKTFLCASNYDEPVFDWHCLPGGHPPSELSHWYAVCGTPHPNRAEFVVVVCTFCMLGLLFFREILWKSNSKKMKTN